MSESNPIELLAGAVIDYADKHNGRLPEWFYALPDREFDAIASAIREGCAA